jgi:peptidyl-prolyl cis-trans isomerase D
MPFQVFRRHQKTMMAALALFAMVAFTLDFSLLRNQMGGTRGNPVVAELYGRKVRMEQVLEMRAQRGRVNRLLSLVFNRPYQEFMGGLDTRAMVDAMILQHEADRLGFPADKDTAVAWLQSMTNPPLSGEMYEQIHRKHFANEITDIGLLEELANQLRLQQVIMLPGTPVTTPYDLFRSYQDQYERVSAFAVAFPVEDYVSRVPEPSDAELRPFYEKYKDALPDRTRETPGFKSPFQVQVEYVSADPTEKARAIEAKLTDEDLRPIYNERRAEFDIAELPTNVFADDPESKLTPAGDRFAEARDLIARTVARERAVKEIDDAFALLQDETLRGFADKYGEAQDINAEAKEAGRPEKPLPSPGPLMKDAAAKLGLTYEKSSLMDRDLAATYGQIGSARRGGGGPMASGTSFADEFFDPRRPLFEETELTDDFGRRFLAWKIAEAPEAVPPLEKIREQVVRAWKFQQARKLAEEAAQAFAKKVEAEGFDMTKAAGTSPVITTSPVPKLQPGAMLSQFQAMPARPSEILQIPDAGEAVREAIFSLEPKQVKVAPNQPKSIYYALTLNQRFPVDMAGLYDPIGPRFTIQQEVTQENGRDRILAWIEDLRRKAGLPDGWVPPDEKGEETASQG